MKFCRPLLLALTLLFWWNMPVSSAEKNDTVLESITFQSDAEKGENIRFKLNGEHIPKIFTIQDANPRVVVDFLDARCSNKLNRIIDTKGKLIKKIRVGIHNEQVQKIRVVVDLAPNGEYQHKHYFDAQDKSLVVTIFSTNTGTHKEKGKKEVKLEDKGTDKKAGEPVKPASSKTVEKKGKEAIIPPAKVPATEKIHTTVTAPSPVASLAPAPQKKETETLPTKQDEGVVKMPEKDGSTPEPENKAIVIPPPDTPPAGITKTPELQQPIPEVTEAKKPAVMKEEKATPKGDIPEKKSTGKKPDPLLSAVTFENTANKGEMVLFKLNDFYPPTVFGIEKGEPSVVCDFPNTRLAVQVKEVLHCKGKFVESVRVSKHSKPNKIRVVLNLVPNKNYDLQQVFFKEDNLFVIIINSLDNPPVENPTTTR
jgi:hypothetical protein